MTFGVRQDGVLLSFLFVIYVDDVIVNLQGAAEKSSHLKFFAVFSATV